MASDPYAAWVHLPPADLSDLDPRFAVETWQEALYYADLGYAALGGPGLKT